MFCFGIGSSVNRYLVEGMARAGLGEPFVVTEPRYARGVAERFRKYISSPALTDVRVTFEGFDAYDVQPTTLPDVLANRPVVLFGKWRGKPQGKIVVSGVHGRGRYRQTLDIAKVKPKEENRALPYLWARARLTDLSDFSGTDPSAAEQQQIVQLGLTYNLLTRYTSFIAVAHAPRNRGGSAERVQAPLALPAGVSNYAVGPPLVGADEPELVTVVMITALLGLVVLARRYLGHGLVAR